MRKFIVYIIVLVITAVTAGYSRDGLLMLTINHGARQAGMASSVVSLSGQTDNIAYNPALSEGSEKFTTSFGHVSYWENIRLESLYFTKNAGGRFNLHGGIRFAALDNIEQRTLVPTPEPINEFDAHDISVKSGLSYEFSKDITVGFSAGWFIEKIESWRGSAFNLDVGAKYDFNDKLSFGFSALNLGSEFKLTKPGAVSSDLISLPKTIIFGSSYKYDKYIGALNIVNVDDKTHIHMGAEGDIHPMFTVRSGYMTGYESKNFTAGFSFYKRNISFDYAFVPFSNNLGTAHFFNLGFTL